MNGFKKKILTLIIVLATLSLCFVALCFLLPDFLGKGTEEESYVPFMERAGQPIKDYSEEASAGTNGVLTAKSEGSAEATVSSEVTEESAEATASSEVTKESAEATASSEATKESAEATASSEATKESNASTASSEATKESNASTASSEATKESNASAASSEATNASAGTAPADGTLVDRAAPVFLAFTASPQIKVGNEFNVHKYVGYADDVDRNVDIEVSGSVDTSKEGTYPIKITLTDDAGRKTTKDMKVQVVSKISSSGSSGKKENFSDFIKNYKTDKTSLGIDISRWQEDVDFEKVKAAGCEFVYMRLGGYDNGEHYTDRYYLKNMAGAKAAGLKVGIYWHSEDSSPEEVKASIDYMMKVLNGESLDFPIAFDWEDFMNFENYDMNLHDVNEVFRAFIREIEARGYSACIYGSKNRLETLWEIAPEESVWLAHYTSATSYAGKYFMWQHSCTGRIDGINGDVDLDVYYESPLSLPQ